MEGEEVWLGGDWVRAGVMVVVLAMSDGGGHHSLHHLLLLDAGRGGGPPACPHAWVGRMGVVLGSWTLQVVLKSTVQVSVV